MTRTRGYLLDTNAALLALTSPAKLSRRVRKAVLTGPNHLSVVAYWEVLLKTMKGAQNTKSPSSTCENTATELPSRQPLPTIALLPT